MPHAQAVNEGMNMVHMGPQHTVRGQNLARVAPVLQMGLNPQVHVKVLG